MFELVFQPLQTQHDTRPCERPYNWEIKFLASPHMRKILVQNRDRLCTRMHFQKTSATQRAWNADSPDTSAQQYLCLSPSHSVGTVLRKNQRTCGAGTRMCVPPLVCTLTEIYHIYIHHGPGGGGSGSSSAQQRYLMRKTRQASTPSVRSCASSRVCSTSEYILSSRHTRTQTQACETRSLARCFQLPANTRGVLCYKSMTCWCTLYSTHYCNVGQVGCMR